MYSAAISPSLGAVIRPVVKPLAALKIRDQLMVAITFGVLVIVLTSAAISSALTRSKFRDVFLAEGAQTTAQLAHQATLALIYESPDNAEEAVKSAFLLPAVTQLEIRTLHGTALVARTPARAITLPIDPQYTTQGLADQTTLEAETDSHWVFVAPVRVGPDSESPFAIDAPPPRLVGYVRLTVSKTPLAKIEQAVLVGQVLILAVFAPIFVLVIRFLTLRLTRTVGALSNAMERARQGDTEVRATGPAGAADIADMATAFNAMMDALQTRQIEGRELLERNRKLAAHLDAVREEQTRLLAQELHDSLGGHFTMLKHGLASLLEDDTVSQPARDELQTLHQLASEAIHIAKNITAAMRPTMLDTLGFNRALKWYADAWSQQTRIGFRLRLGDDSRLTKTHATALFRIAQEALTNVARHAKASRVDVTSATYDDTFHLSIADDGRGMLNPDAAGAGLGILGMVERATYLDGHVDLHSIPNSGTTISVRIPLPPLLAAATSTDTTP